MANRWTQPIAELVQYVCMQCNNLGGHKELFSGVGTIAAVAALAATLFSPILIFIVLTLQFYS